MLWTHGSLPVAMVSLNQVQRNYTLADAYLNLNDKLFLALITLGPCFIYNNFLKMFIVDCFRRDKTKKVTQMAAVVSVLPSHGPVFARA